MGVDKFYIFLPSPGKPQFSSIISSTIEPIESRLWEYYRNN